jgi:hypothetical protein
VFFFFLVKKKKCVFIFFGLYIFLYKQKFTLIEKRKRKWTVLNKYQIPKPNIKEMGEFALVKLTNCQNRTKKPALHQSKKAATQIQKKTKK